MCSVAAGPSLLGAQGDPHPRNEHSCSSESRRRFDRIVKQPQPGGANARLVAAASGRAGVVGEATTADADMHAWVEPLIERSQESRHKQIRQWATNASQV